MSETGIIFLLIIAAVIINVVVFRIRKQTVMKNGIVTSASVIKVDTETVTMDSGVSKDKYRYYIKFTVKNGKSMETELLGKVPDYISEGDKIEVKYLLDNPRRVYLNE